MADIESNFLINRLLRSMRHDKPPNLETLAKHKVSAALAAHYARTHPARTSSRYQNRNGFGGSSTTILRHEGYANKKCWGIT